MKPGPKSSFVARFWKQVNKNGPIPSHIHNLGQCWLWNGRSYKGYGRISYFHNDVQAQRASWTINCGAIPEQLCVLHKCDNPTCVNPNHLFLGTRSDNVADMISKGRKRYGIRIGSDNNKTKLTAEQVYEIRSLIGSEHAVASRFGVTVQNVRHIRNRKTWKHLPDTDFLKQPTT